MPQHEKVPRPIARAIVQCLAQLPGSAPLIGPHWYCALRVATHLRGSGITACIHEASHALVLGEHIRLPLYGRHKLMVCGADLAGVVYRYCFGEPRETAGGSEKPWWARLCTPLVTAGTAFLALWRLLTLLTPSPRAIWSCGVFTSLSRKHSVGTPRGSPLDLGVQSRVYHDQHACPSDSTEEQL